MAPASQFELESPPKDAISTLEFAPESSSRLLASSWDRHVHLYEIEGQQGTLVRSFEHRAPVLDVCFGANDGEAYSGGIDQRILRLDLESGEQSEIGRHDAPVRCVVYNVQQSILVSASWDCTIQIHRPLSTAPPIAVALPGKPHALAVSPSKVVVAMTARLVHIYDLGTIASASTAADITPWQQRESSLKFLTRAVACMPNDAGYATSSIEGRVAVEWFEDSAESQARKYAFKCHRQAEGDGDVVYPVNALKFHPIHGTFASGGGDGTVALWDAEAKRRLKQYQKFPSSVAALAFSKNGKYLAIGVCPGFETGQEDYSGEGQTKIFIRELGESEAKGKAAK